MMSQLGSSLQEIVRGPIRAENMPRAKRGQAFLQYDLPGLILSLNRDPMREPETRKLGYGHVGGRALLQSESERSSRLVFVARCHSQAVGVEPKSWR